MTDADDQPAADDPASPSAEDKAVERRRAIEAVLMVADRPVAPNVLAQLLEIPTDQVVAMCETLGQDYERDRRGFVLARVAGGYRLQSHPDLASYLERFVLEGQSTRLSSAALETLAIVAYKQPVSRAQVAAIRGVSVDGVMRTLTQRDLIVELGRDPGPGQPLMYGTSNTFLERLGLDHLNELPALGDFVPGPEVVEALEQGLRTEQETAGVAEMEAHANAAIESDAAIGPDAGAGPGPDSAPRGALADDDGAPPEGDVDAATPDSDGSAAKVGPDEGCGPNTVVTQTGSVDALFVTADAPDLDALFDEER